MVNSLINTLLVATGLFVYLSLFRQVAARGNGAPALGEKELGLPEAVAALLLIGWFVLTVLVAARVEPATLQTRELLYTGGFNLAIVSILTALLQLRGFKVVSLGGFSRLGFGRIVSTAAVLLFAAYPLLFAADSISRWVLGEGAGKQQIVEMFTGSETLQQRILIIVLAIAIAPLAEEFISASSSMACSSGISGAAPESFSTRFFSEPSMSTCRVSSRSLFSADVSLSPTNGAGRFSSR
jgi:hypothetical protein